MFSIKGLRVDVVSDHLLISGKPSEVRVSPEGAVEALQDCFERTDKDCSKQLPRMTSTIT